MEMIKKYAGILMMLTLLVGFTSCESEDETEFNLPGEWYTNEEIDFGAYTWGRGTLMTFNARNQGTIGSAGDPNYLVFEWRWIDGGEVCRNARCTSFFVHHYTNLFTFFKLRSFEDFFDLCVPSI